MDRRRGICRSPLGHFLGDGCGEPAGRMGSRACEWSVRMCREDNGREVLHLVSIRENLKFATVIMTLEGDTVGKRADGSVLIFPAAE